MEDIVTYFQNQLTRFPLPKKGWLGGSFVCKIVSDYFSVPYPKFHDIDIFYPGELPETTPQKPKDFYRGIPCRILRAQRQGNINTITLLDIGSLEEVINRFDLNCCMAGYDIETNFLYLSDEFKHFLLTRQMQVISLDSPLFTALRILKKSHDGIPCDVRTEMALLRYPLSQPKARRTLRELGQLKIAKNRIQSFSRYLDECKSHLPIAEQEEILYLLKPNRATDSSLTESVSCRDLKTFCPTLRGQRQEFIDL